MIGDYLGIAVKNITKKGVRSWLTMLGIFIGIAAVVSLISLGQGLEDAVMEQFSMMGYNVIMVMPGSELGTSFGSLKLDEHDEKIVKSVRGVEEVAPMNTKLSKVTFEKEVVYTWIAGVPVDDRYKVIEDMQSVRIREGRKPQPGDKYKTVIGIMFTEGDVFDNKEVKVGDKVTIDDYEFKVMGILERIGNSQDDATLWIPLETSQEIYNEKGLSDAFMARTKEGFKPSDVAERVKEKMRHDRGLKEGEEDFLVQTAEQLSESYGGVLNAVQTVFVGIAMISLMVGGIGIMNTMYTSVLERTQEIGVMKAIGARNSDILMMFLVESGLLGLVGGSIGVLIGLSMSKSVEYYAVAMNLTMLQASTSPTIIIGALAFSFIVGCISGVMPAMRAAKLKPVDALRYE
jgi:putative ABC transport system permease protein